MLFPSFAVIALASAGIAEARSLPHIRGVERPLGRRQNDNSLNLDPNAVQQGSFGDGSKEIGANEANQAKSLTSQNNFINYCAGKTLTNGLQILTGSCNGIIMGDIPAKNKMMSSIITFPRQGGAPIPSDTTFNITVQMSGIEAGAFTNADATYYAAPQQLVNGVVQGHTHVTVQDLGKDLNPKNAPDPTQFAFFKGINDPGNGRGLLTAVVTGGLPAGNYRVCTMASASNHQPALMPVAQRGTVDDCTKFVVSGDGTTINDAANNGSKGIAAAAAAASAVAAGSSNNNSKGSSSPSNNNSKGSSSLNNNSQSSSSSSASGSSSSGSALGGIAAPPVTDSGNSKRPFEVNGNTFVNKSAAVQRACDIQFNACANAVNGQKLAGVTISQCSAQQQTCLSSA
ncbi:hypothetical protein F5884DRAFT_871910 [Xylogone sp. PMI_703]|nr:hypothetical protein F5884DRAFT_871910 [Xylogone sp. PMI_703]